MARLNLSPEAQEARKQYTRKYYAEHKEALNKYNAEWKRQHPEQVRQHLEAMWERKAQNLGLKEE